MMLQAIDAAKNLYYGSVESDKMKTLREGVKAGMHTAKMIASVVLVLSIATIFFGLYFGFGIGGTLGYFFSVPSFVLGSIGAVISYDVITASEKGYQLADKPVNFAPFDNMKKENMPAVTKHCRSLVDQMLESTYVLKYASGYVLNRYWDSITNLLKIKPPSRSK